MQIGSIKTVFDSLKQNKGSTLWKLNSAKVRVHVRRKIDERQIHIINEYENTK